MGKEHRSFWTRLALQVCRVPEASRALQSLVIWRILVFLVVISTAQPSWQAQPSPGCNGPAQSRHGQKPSRNGMEEGETLCQSEFWRQLPKGVTKLCQWKVGSRGQTPQLSPCGCPCTARGGWLQHRVCREAQLRWADILVF